MPNITHVRPSETFGNSSSTSGAETKSVRARSAPMHGKK